MGSETKKDTELPDEKTDTGDENKEPTFMAELEDVLDKELEANKPEGEAPGDGDSEGKAPEKKDDSESKPAGKDKESGADDQGDGSDGQGKSEQEDGKGGEEAPAVDEALLERAVRAGMSLADAKVVTDGEALGRIVGHLEETAAAAAKAKADDSASEEEGAGEEEDPLADIPDLDPEEFDEKIVKSFSALKSLAGQLIKDNKELHVKIAESVDARNGSWIDGEVAKLGEEYADVFGEGNLAELPAGKQKLAREKLLRHVEFVESDAKAEGETITKAETFKRAVSSAFGDTVKAKKGAAAAKAAAERSKKAVNRPRDTSGRFGSDPDAAEHGSDDEREVDATKAVAALMEDG